MSKRFQIARMADLPPIGCPCGQARRAFADDADGVASLHVVDISVDARVHYHKRMTELYYVLEGEGHIELDGKRHAVRPGDAILIKPLCATGRSAGCACSTCRCRRSIQRMNGLINWIVVS